MALTVLRRFYDEEDIFHFNLKYLFYVGLWPKENWTKNTLLVYKVYEFILHVLSIVFLIITAIGTYKKKDDVTIFLSSMDKSLAGYNFVLKVLVFVIKRDKIKILIEDMVQSGDEISEKRKKLMVTHVIIVTLLTTGVAGAFSIFAQFKGEMTIEAWMPFDPMENRMNLALAGQILFITFVVPCSCRALAMQGIVCSMIMYLCDQLIHLQNKIKHLKYSKDCDERIREEFKCIVKKHMRLMRYSNSMENIFKEYFLIQNLVVTVELCLNAMMITLVGLEQKPMLASFLAFLFVVLMNAYIYCYLGNELITQSAGLALAAYESAWTSWPVDLQKDLLTLIMVAQRPLKMSAGGIALLSIETYSQALYNGYSIFAVLNDIVD